MRSVLTAAVLLSSLAIASPSAAIEADPFELVATGDKPHVAVDGDGNAHFVWNRSRATGPDETLYCRVPPGGTSCEVRRRFSPGGGDPENNTDSDGPRVLVGGGNVIVVSRRCCGGFGPSPTDGVFARRSTDGGKTFGPLQLVGNESIAGDAIRGPTGAFSTISDGVAGGTFYQAHRAGTFARQSANLGDADPAQSNSGSLALIDANTPIATFDDLTTTFWRRYSGSGAYNNVASWTPTATVGAGTEGRLASGPSGVWLLYRVGSPGSMTLVAREFTGDGFEKQIEVSETGDPTLADFSQDSAGRLHAVWRRRDGALMYRRSEDGDGYGRTTTLVTPSSEILGLEVAAGEDGNGWVVWDAADGNVRAAALHVDPDPPTIGKDVTVTVVKGEVLIKLPKGKTATVSQKGSDFVPVSVVRSIPVGSIVDTTEGTIRLASRRKKGGKKQSGTFSAGVFQVLQSRKAKAKGLTELRLKGSIAKHCPKGKKSGVSATASRKLSKKTIRRLRSKAKGRYRTRGRRSAATVRGTTWTVADRCDGTLTKVKRGKVSVRDFRAKRTIILKRGKRYLAKAPGA